MDRVALVGRQFRPFIEDVDDMLPDLISVHPCQTNPLNKGTFF
jgi:hypothetical protein